MNTHSRTHFEGFDYPINEVKRFLFTCGIFTLAVTPNNNIVHYLPEDCQAFQDWLLANNVLDIRTTFPVTPSAHVV